MGFNQAAKALRPMAAATETGVLDGTNPQGLVTREMLAEVLYKVGLVGTGIRKTAQND